MKFSEADIRHLHGGGGRFYGGIGPFTVETVLEKVWDDVPKLAVLAAVDDEVCGAVEDN